VDEKVTENPGSPNKVKGSSTAAQRKDLLIPRYNRDYVTSDILAELERENMRYQRSKQGEIFAYINCDQKYSITCGFLNGRLSSRP
jgi:hypothetical protein